MSVTKTAVTIVAANTTCNASGTVTGNVANLATALGAVLTGKITNGGTGPTIAASAYIYTSPDGANMKLLTTLQGETSAGLTAEFAVALPMPVMFTRVDFHDNTGQPVTCEAFLQQLSSV